MHDTYEQNNLTDRRVVATSPTYLGARELVDYLVSENMPREKLTIAAEEMRFSQEVTGGSEPSRTIVRGILSGAVTGLVFGLIFGHFSWIESLISEIMLALYGVLSGAVIGALFALAVHRFSLTHRSPYRGGRLRAGRYAVLATEDLADEATRIAHAINHPTIRPRAIPFARVTRRAPLGNS